MIHRRLDDMVGGWIVGNFEPSCFKSEACEVACKHYAAGTEEPGHVHRIATEITLVASGRVRMNGRIFVPGDIVILQPGEPTDFQALEASLTVVVKLPSVAGDKHLVEACGEGGHHEPN